MGELMSDGKAKELVRKKLIIFWEEMRNIIREYFAGTHFIIFNDFIFTIKSYKYLTFQISSKNPPIPNWGGNEKICLQLGNRKICLFPIVTSKNPHAVQL
jgi:hypothetical protein